MSKSDFEKVLVEKIGYKNDATFMWVSRYLCAATGEEAKGMHIKDFQIIFDVPEELCIEKYSEIAVGNVLVARRVLTRILYEFD